MATRVVIERHRVAVNATVAQQLATSKRVQMLLSRLGEEGFAAFGLTPQEVRIPAKLNSHSGQREHPDP